MSADDSEIPGTPPEGPGDPLLRDPLFADVPVRNGKKCIGNCILVAFVGRGGMGTVYRGRHVGFDLDVAVKFLRPELARESPEFLQKFLREARVAASLTHVNLIRVFDVGEDHGVHYIVMEFVDGESIQELVARRGALPPAEAWRILVDAASGLSHAHRHARRIVHRDVKPGNILIRRDGRVKVADLGLAKPIEETDVTQGQQVFGSPAYMPVEQWEDARTIGPPADVYALGATAYFMLAGRSFIEGGSAVEIMKEVLRGRVPLFAKIPGVPPELARVLQKSVASEAKNRFADAGAFLEALQEVGPPEGEVVGGDTLPAGARSRRPRKRRWGRPALAGAVLVCAGAGYLLWPHREREEAAVGAAADLAVAMEVDEPAPAEGGTVVYRLRVANDGPDAARDVEVTDALPRGLAYVSDSPSQGAYVAGTGVWTVGTLARGDLATLAITASVDSGTAGSTITNAAAVTASDPPDADSAEGAASIDIAVRVADGRKEDSDPVRVDLPPPPAFREYEIVTVPLVDVRVDGKLVPRDPVRGKGKIRVSAGAHKFRIETPSGAEWVETYVVTPDDVNNRLVFDVGSRTLRATTGS